MVGLIHNYMLLSAQIFGLVCYKPLAIKKLSLRVLFHPQSLSQSGPLQVFSESMCNKMVFFMFGFILSPNTSIALEEEWGSVFHAKRKTKPQKSEVSGRLSSGSWTP